MTAHNDAESPDPNRPNKKWELPYPKREVMGDSCSGALHTSDQSVDVA